LTGETLWQEATVPNSISRWQNPHVQWRLLFESTSYPAVNTNFTLVVCSKGGLFRCLIDGRCGGIDFCCPLVTHRTVYLGSRRGGGGEWKSYRRKNTPDLSLLTLTSTVVTNVYLPNTCFVIYKLHFKHSVTLYIMYVYQKKPWLVF
jgi:hypothetical protein